MGNPAYKKKRSCSGCAAFSWGLVCVQSRCSLGYQPHQYQRPDNCPAKPHSAREQAVLLREGRVGEGLPKCPSCGKVVCVSWSYKIITQHKAPGASYLGKPWCPMSGKEYSPPD